MDASRHFRGKRVTLMGLGLLGRGVGDARFLASCGARLTVTDLKPAPALAPSLAALAQFPGVRYVLGRHDRSDFSECDLVVKAAGVPLGSPYVATAERAGVPVRMSADLFAEISGAPIAGITGTRGKTTTTYMVRDMLEASGRRALLGGNVLGVSTLALLADYEPGHVAVLELDSWQLQGFRAAGISPRVAAFTTFYPDHQRYYRGDTAAYLADKAAVFERQAPGEALVVGEQAFPTLVASYPAHAARATVARAADVADWELPIPGAHSRQNLAVAAAAARAMGVPEAAARAAAARFAGVPWRLELVRELRGARVYNDTAAVIPEATIAGLEALAPAPTILIAGGADKGSDVAPLAAAAARAKRVVLVAGSGTDRIRPLLPDAAVYATLDEAVADAAAHAEPGDAVLFSPAFSSRGAFGNVFERGARFNELVAAL